MKKIILIFGLILAFAFTNVYTQEKQGMPTKKKTEVKSETQQAETKSQSQKIPKDAIKGTVVSLKSFAMSGDGSVTAADAEQLVNSGSPLAFMQGLGKKGIIYIVFNMDGSFAGKKLAKYAGKNIYITGKKKTINGVKFIVLENIGEIP